MPLNEVEITQLKEAMRVLTQFKGMPQFDWMEEVFAKIDQSASPHEQNTIISFDANQYLIGIEWLGVIYAAIKYRKVIELDYKDFKVANSYKVSFSPYYLKQYNNRWFAFGHKHESIDPTTTLALDRILEIKELNIAYHENTIVKFDEYFDDIIGVTIPKDETLQKIELKIAPERAGYVLTKPLHGSQKKVLQDTTGLYVSLEVIVNPELEQLILSFGDQIQVLSPEGLKKQILGKLEKAISQYKLE
jgi:predicted DNA-binding transcriptional regulator YafY